MLGSLKDAQIDRIIHANQIGRLGCGNGDLNYIIPLTYCYDGDKIYFHTKKGLKTEILSKHPSVCFQIDEIDALDNWRSVLIWGNCVKVEKDQEEILNLFYQRYMPYKLGVQSLPKHLVSSHGVQTQSYEQDFYVINIDGKSGRYERT